MDLREVHGLLGTAIGTELHRLARGIDERPVAPRGAAKQVSAETTFDTDLTAMAAVHDAVARMTEAAHRRLVASGRAARTVTVKVRSADFTTSSRSETAGTASTDLASFTAVAQRLARAAVPEGGVRLIGVSLAGLTDDPPPALFETLGPPDAPVPSEPTVSGAAEEAIDPAVERPWRPGDDIAHAEHGHGWVQGAGHGRVTVRFETRSTGPGRARTFAADDPDLRRADPLASLD
jgi:DNA polymerase IV